MQEVINLSKGQTIDLRKNSKGESVYDLSQITVGLGWDVREEKIKKSVELEQSTIDKLFGRPKKVIKKMKLNKKSSI